MEGWGQSRQIEKKMEAARIFVFPTLAITHSGTWIYLWITRFKFSGKVCSGDFLVDDQDDSKYLIEVGLFIRFTLGMFSLLCIILCLIFGILGCFLMMS